MPAIKFGVGFGQGSRCYTLVILKRIEQVAVCLAKIRLQFQGAAIAGDCFVKPTCPLRDHAEEMNRVGMVRLDVENLPVNRLGLLQPPILMVLIGNRQIVGDHGYLFKFRRSAAWRRNRSTWRR